MFMRASRNRPSPGYQFGLSKEEQDYIYGTSVLSAHRGADVRGHLRDRTLSS